MNQFEKLFKDWDGKTSPDPKILKQALQHATSEAKILQLFEAMRLVISSAAVWKFKTKYFPEPLELSLEEFSVERAEEFCDPVRNNWHNRNLRNEKVRGQARDMLAGLWQFRTTPFAESLVPDPATGKMRKTTIDGQHTAAGIAMSQCPQQVLVLRGLPLDAQKYIDHNATPRCFADTVKIYQFSKMNPNLVSAITRRGFHGKKGRWGGGLSDGSLEQFYFQHRVAIEDIGRMFPKSVPRITVAPVMAALMHAWYYVDDKSKLRRFVQLLVAPLEGTKKETAALKLHDFLTRKTHTGADSANDTYIKTQVAFRAFLRGHPTEQLRPADSDLYPLPHLQPQNAKIGKANGSTRHTVAWFKKTYYTPAQVLQRKVTPAPAGMMPFGNDSEEPEVLMGAANETESEPANVAAVTHSVAATLGPSGDAAMTPTQ